MKKLISLVLALALMLCAVSALAAYPEKAVECTMPWAAGGGGDLAFRAFGEVWTKVTGQPYVIKNVAGTSGVTGVLANEVNAAVCNTPEGMSNVNAGQIRILASFASKPFKDYPDVPLAKDSGVKGTENLVIEQWRSIAVPADTPDEVVAEMAEVAKKVVEDPDFIEKCNTLSIVARYRNVEEINEFVQSENTRFENLIKSKGFGDRYGKK